jgi:small subunit ribosomal protein S17
MELTGKVVSTKMKKTVVIEVESLVAHPLYKKRVRVKKNFKAHDNLGVKVGETVKIKSCRPISKDKHFEVIGLLNK